MHETHVQYSLFCHCCEDGVGLVVRVALSKLWKMDLWLAGFLVDNLHSRCHLHASQEPNSTLIDLVHAISLASLFSRLHRPLGLCGDSHRSALSRWCAACPTGDWC